MPENVNYSPDRMLCRGKSLQTGQWITGYFLRTQEGKEKKLCCYIAVNEMIAPELPGKQNQIEVDPESICRHTGYQKNGVDVWENDRIKYHFGESVGVIRFGEYQNCFDSQTARHDGFYVDWGENDMLRKDLGYWIAALDEEDNVITQEGESI